MRNSDVKITKVWWSRKFALRWRYDFLGFWRTAGLFGTIEEADEARIKFLEANSRF